MSDSNKHIIFFSMALKKTFIPLFLIILSILHFECQIFFFNSLKLLNANLYVLLVNTTLSTQILQILQL